MRSPDEDNVRTYSRLLRRQPPEFHLPGPALLIAAVVLLVQAASGVAGTQAIASEGAQAEQYLQAWRAHEQQAAAYWGEITEKRRIRNAKRRDGQRILPEDYVLQRPPVYSGPPRPPELAPPTPPRPAIPVVADFLRHAAEQFGFVPRRPPEEAAFKRAYARAAIAAGLTREQAVGIYVLETGGDGTHDTQAGFPGPDRPAISPALGYNQLLSTTTIGLIAEHGDRLLEILTERAHGLDARARPEMQERIEALRRMVAFSRSVPFQWSEHDRLAKTTPGGMGIHAVLLDLDLGPWLQARQLANSVRHARSQGFQGTLTPAELQLMNLTGPGNGLDMAMMPPDLRQIVPTANFFQQAGYERNPIAQRTGVVSGLIAHIEERMERGAWAQGARRLAAAFDEVAAGGGQN